MRDVTALPQAAYRLFKLFFRCASAVVSFCFTLEMYIPGFLFAFFKWLIANL